MKLKNLNNHNTIPSICITFGFLGFAGFVFWFTYCNLEEISFRSILEATIGNSMGVAAAIVFGGVGIMLLGYIFKKPVYFKAKLISKTINKVNNKETLCFNVYNEEKNSSIPLRQYFLSNEPTDLIENMDYALYVKEFNWKVVKIEKIDGTMNFVTKTPPVAMKPVIYMIGFVILFPVLCFVISLFL